MLECGAAYSSVTTANGYRPSTGPRGAVLHDPCRAASRHGSWAHVSPPTENSPPGGASEPPSDGAGGAGALPPREGAGSGVGGLTGFGRGAGAGRFAAGGVVAGFRCLDGVGLAGALLRGAASRDRRFAGAVAASRLLAARRACAWSADRLAADDLAGAFGLGLSAAFGSLGFGVAAGGCSDDALCDASAAGEDGGDLSAADDAG